ncbi:MAG: hypothetical protein RSB59_04620 [Clostridia bacterium]
MCRFVNCPKCGQRVLEIEGEESSAILKCPKCGERLEVCWKSKEINLKIPNSEQVKMQKLQNKR